MPVLILLIAIVAGVVFYSDSAVPGDTLYPIDTATEKVWETFTLDSVAQARLRVKFSAERVSEINKLAALGNIPEMNYALMGLQQNLRDAVDSTKKLIHGSNESLINELSDSIGADIEAIQSMRASGKFSQDEGEFLSDVQDYLKIEKERVESNLTDVRLVIGKLARFIEESATGATFADQKNKNLTAKAGDETDQAKVKELKSLAEFERQEYLLFVEQGKALQKESLHLQNS